MRNKIYTKNTEYIACSQNLSKNLHFHKTFVYLDVGRNFINTRHKKKVRNSDNSRNF